MGHHIDIAGVATWVETMGEAGDVVLMLHGGLSSSDTLLGALGASIAAGHRVVAFDRRGHGRTADTDAPFHYDEMATETIAVLDDVIGGRAHLVGWSDGGIVAVIVARRRPDLVDKLVLIGTNFHVDGLRPIAGSGGDAVVDMMAQAYGELSPDGIEHFPVVAAKAFTLFDTEPTMTVADLADIAAPTLVMVGDDDLTELGHTCSMYEALPAGQLSVVPGASHALPLEKPAEAAAIIISFLDQTGPPQTLMPSRRAR